MGKNKGKGGKAFRSGKGDQEMSSKREFVKKEDDEESYARIKAPLGCHRMLCILPDGKEIIGTIRGALIRKALMAAGHTVLVSKREFQKDVVDIVHLYNDDEVKQLVKDGDIPSDFRATSDMASTENKGYVFTTERQATNAVSEIDRQIMNEHNTVREYDPLADVQRNKPLLGQAGYGEDEEDADLDDV